MHSSTSSHLSFTPTTYERDLYEIMAEAVTESHHYDIEGCRRLLIAVFRRAWADRKDPLRRHDARRFLTSPVVEAIGEELGISPKAIRATIAGRF